MAKTHATLSPVINILLTLVWGAVASVLMFFIKPRIPYSIGLIGAELGTVCGVMQHLSIKQARDTFSTSSSLLDVRRALKSNAWGRRFILWLYFSKLVLAATVFIMIRQPFKRIILGYLAGYMVLMFVRELITLKDTFALQRLPTKSLMEE